MLTHEITVAQPIKKLSKQGRRRVNRLRQDLRCKKFAVGDTVLVKEAGADAYGQILEIEYDIDMVKEWDGDAPLNVLVFLYDDQSDFLFNIQSLKVI